MQGMLLGAPRAPRGHFERQLFGKAISWGNYRADTCVLRTSLGRSVVSPKGLGCILGRLGRFLGPLGASGRL